MIKLEKLTKIYYPKNRQPVVAASNIDLEIKTGKIYVFLGPSGCGKTTTLKMINKLIEATSGNVYINGKNTNEFDENTLRRKIGYVIQQIGLFPNMTIAENISVVPKLLGWNKIDVAKRVSELFEMISLDEEYFADRYPNQLSGGQQQRIGVVRALAGNPELLLMDEPFGAIDPINRAEIQDNFMEMQQKLNKTVIFVSHDIEEAVKMADKIVLFNNGELVQASSPKEILENPKNKFVKNFLGDNVIQKRLSLLPIKEVMTVDNYSVTYKDNIDKARSYINEMNGEYVAVVGPNGRARGYITSEMIEDKKGIVKKYFKVLSGIVEEDKMASEALNILYGRGFQKLVVVDNDLMFKGYITHKSISNVVSRVG